MLYSGYHHISMAKEDEEKTAFITPFGVYCYVKMSFGLTNAGATYQRLMQKTFSSQQGHNLEDNIDDLVVKSSTRYDHLKDLTKTFENVNKYGIKLNPEKCTSGVNSGKLLGFLVFFS